MMADDTPNLGDSRPEATDVDAMQFCWVPPGIFLLGSGDDDPLAYDDEKPQCETAIPHGYWLKRFPVTVAQFSRFVSDAGFPAGNEHCLAGPPSHPVVRVSWFEAFAFCQWLTRRWQALGLLADGWAVTLPSEAEWEKAARGGLEVPQSSVILSQPFELRDMALKPNPHPGRIYPWGPEAKAGIGDFAENGIAQTGAVGSFPEGASPYGVEDMCSNVWEWTRSILGDYPYPEDVTDRHRRESLEAKGFRVLRGGAFEGRPDSVRCGWRNSLAPGFRNHFVGIRVMDLAAPVGQQRGH